LLHWHAVFGDAAEVYGVQEVSVIALSKPIKIG